MQLTNQPPATTCADSFCVYDFPFRLRTNVPEVEHLFAGLYRNLFGPGIDDSGDKAVLQLECDGRFFWSFHEKAGTTSTLSSALWNLEAALCESIIRSQRRSITIHAATIRLENSVALLAGCSETGKTTLSLALTHRGFRAAVDDVALVEPETLNVLPIPRCFHVDDRGATLLEADGLQLPPAWSRFRFIVPNDFGVTAAPATRAGFLLFMQGPRAERPSIAPVSQAEMAARVLTETLQGPIAEPEALAVICRLVAGSSCFALTPGPLAETADEVAALLKSRSAAV